MQTERRKHPRVRVLLDGHWRAKSAGGFFRLADLSLGGCFLQSPRAPAEGQQGTLTIYFKHDGPMVVEGEVVRVSPPAGFGVRFPHLTSSHEFQLSIQLETLKDQEHADRFPVHAYVWKSRTAIRPLPPASSEPSPKKAKKKKRETHGPGTPKTPPRKGTD